ncbi:MAG: hypothetical protein ACFFBZ_12995 [Promethearchaeota archaeon]
MRESRKLDLEYKKLLIKDIKLAMKHKKILNMIDRIELWRIIKLQKEFEGYEEDLKNKSKYRERIHV